MLEVRTRMQDIIRHNMELEQLLQYFFASWREEEETKTPWESLECKIVGCKERHDGTISFSLGRLFPAVLKCVVKSDFLKSRSLQQ
jgi:hypothetical protein